MTTEFNDAQHYGLFMTGTTLTSQTGKYVRQSELTLAALRAAGVLNNMEDGTTAPAHDKLWLDKNSDPAVLKEWDSVSSTWQAMTFDRLFGRATVTDLTNVAGTANAVTADEPSPFMDGKIYGLVPTLSNTGATTIQVAGVGTYDVVYPDGTDIAAGELAANLRTPLLFTNGRFEVLFGSNAGSVKRSEVDASSFGFVLPDDDTLAGASATKLARSKNVKAYVDTPGTGKYQRTPGDATFAILSSVNKMSQRADLRDWDGLDLTDDNDNATLVQAAITSLAASGDVLHVPNGQIVLGSQITLPGGARIKGTGRSPGPYAATSSYFHIGHTGKGFLMDDASLAPRGFEGVNFYRTQPTPGTGWEPTAHDFDIAGLGISNFILVDCHFHNPSKLLSMSGSLDGAGRVNNRAFIRGITGQPLMSGFELTHMYDTVFMDEIQFWPFWSLNADVISYTRLNAYAHVLKRIDNPMWGRVFAWGYYRGVFIAQQPSVGLDGMLPGGTVNKLNASAIGMDNCGCGLLFDPDSDGATVHIGDLLATSASSRPSTTTEALVRMLGDNSRLTIGSLFGQNTTRNLVQVAGTGNLAIVGASYSVSIDSDADGDAEFSVATGNRLVLETAPTTSAATKYATAGTGIIETPDWRSYTPTLTAASGTFTSATVTGSFQRTGKTVKFQVAVVITTNGTAATAARVTLPFTAANKNFIISGRDQTAGPMLQGLIPANGTFVSVTKYDNTYPGVDGHTLYVSGEYEAA